MADTIPDFRWSAFYYPEIFAAVVLMKRQKWPEHTEEDPLDPVMQMLALFAILAHLQAVRLDHAARELYLPTLRLRSSLIALARLVGVELATAVPAEVELVADVSGSVSSTTTLLLEGSIAATDGGIEFEYSGADVELDATGAAAWEVLEDDGGTFSTLAVPDAPWGGTPVAQDALYIGAPAMFNKVHLVVSGSPSIDLVRWEYRDDYRVKPPDTVTVVASTLRFRVSTLIGDTNGAGLAVTVKCLRTGATETCVTSFALTYNAVTTSDFLGQTSPSTNAADYEVTADWIELPGLTDGTGNLEASGDVTWTLPENTERRWAESDPDASGTDRFFVRARVITPGGGTASPTIAAPTEPRRTTWSIRWDVRQGRTVTERIGTTDSGSADQTFTLTQSPFMSMTTLTVGGDEWEVVSNFLASASNDRHVRLRELPDGSWEVKFGNGTNGRIPDASSAVEATYRIGGDESGNVGVGTIVRDSTGNSKIRNLRNPRAAAGWVAQEGTTPASLEGLRESIPAEVRAGDRCVSLPDYETAAIAFRTADGSQVAVRAVAIEEVAGPKTIGVYCVGPGGVVPSSSDLAELEVHFNGRTVGSQRSGGIVPANTRVTVLGYIPRLITVDVDLSILEDYASTAEAAAIAALQATVSPLAKRKILDANGNWVDGSTYLALWGGTFAPSSITVAVGTSLDGIVAVTVNDPAAPITLEEGELPVIDGTPTVNVTSVES